MTKSLPQNALTRFLEASTGILYLPMVYSFVAWLPLIVWQWKRYTARQRLWQIGFYAAGSAAFLLFGWINPGQFFNWLED